VVSGGWNSRHHGARLPSYGARVADLHGCAERPGIHLIHHGDADVTPTAKATLAHLT
jgi:hypothetical protein